MPAKRTKLAKAIFQIEAPDARDVHLVGEFTGWEAGAIKLKKSKNGNWKATVALPAGTHQYRFMVDGKWCDDPSATERIINAFGTQNCIGAVGQD
jgi:1,4-alpha-glucan branching enzyme